MRGTARRAVAYHAGGLGDFVLSVPALMRLAGSRPGAEWCYWGPRQRLVLLPGWTPPPAALSRGEASLWGARPAPEAARWLAAADPVAAFAARPPPWLPPPPRGVHLQAFPEDSEVPGEWVPAFQGRQLGAAGVPRLTRSWLPGWQRRVLPHRPGGSLVLHHGSGDRAKNLPPATWRAALDALSRELPLAPLVLEGPVERERGADPFDWGAERVASASLEELLAVLARASLVLGSDSGVTHLAALLGIPTVVAYGPSDPGRWRPLGPRVALVRPPRDCAPCCGAPPVRCEHLSCLGEIPAAALVAAARALLDPDRGPRDQGIHPERR